MNRGPSPEAVAAASLCLQRGARVMFGLDGHTPSEAAALAYRPGGPSVVELTARIEHRRAGTSAQVAA